MSSRGPITPNVKKTRENCSNQDDVIAKREYPELYKFLTEVPSNALSEQTGTITFFRGKHSFCVILRDRAYDNRVFLHSIPLGPTILYELEKALKSPELLWEHNQESPKIAQDERKPK